MCVLNIIYCSYIVKIGTRVEGQLLLYPCSLVVLRCAA